MGGWRGFSLVKQTDIATAAAVNTLMQFEGDPIEPETDNHFLNTDEITGELLPTTHRLLTRKLAGKQKSKAYPHIVGLFASMAMGKDTVTAAGATGFKHKLEIDKTVVELPYRTMIENDGDTQHLYKGVACVGFTISGERGGFVEFEADLIGAATEAVDATAKPPRLAESYMVYGEVNLTRGGAYDGTAVTGGVSLAAQLMDFKLGFKNNGKGVYLMGDPSGAVGQIRRGQKYEVEFEANIEIEDQSHRNALLAGTEYVMHIPIVGGVIGAGPSKYTIEIIMPRVIYREAKKGLNDGTLQVGAKFGVLADVTYGGLIINVINTHAASYLAAA
jgi:hypothetical protein